MTVSFLDAVNARIEDILDTCTKCGRCVEACPMVEPAGLDKTKAPAIVGGILGYMIGLRGGLPLIVHYGGYIGVKREHIARAHAFFE